MADANDERKALQSAILDSSRRLLDLGVPPDEIVLRGVGYTVTILRRERCGDCVHRCACAWDDDDAACPDFERRGKQEVLPL